MSLAFLTAGAPRAATPKPITGKLSKAGYTVIALAPSGKGTSVRGRIFKIRPPASVVTLHLRAANGRYAGPIVVGTKGKLAIVGVKAGAKLGTINVRSGYARIAKRLPKRFVDARRVARANKGIPIGARVFGRVASRPSATPGLPGQDGDVDGVPNALDIDDDGDRLLDNFERVGAGSASADHFRFAQTPSEYPLFSSLVLPLSATVNAHAGPLTVEQIDATLSSRGVLSVFKIPGDSQELDCGGLSYCSAGGTGKIAFGPASGQPFPECCDPDGDGFGSIASAHTHFFFLLHGATTAQIRTGDVFIERVTTGGVETQYPATLQGVIATVPALKSYDDGQGTAATISYPTPWRNFPVKAGPGGNVVLTGTFWRPQRRPIQGEEGEWIDIGGLTYQVRVGCFPNGTCPAEACPQDAYSTTDPNLRPASLPAYMDGALSDSAKDKAADPANTLTYSVDLTRCLAVNGLSWTPGQGYLFNFSAFNHTASGIITDIVQQGIDFKLQ